MQQAKGDAEVLEGIGDRLREERVKAGISQRELARRLGLSASLISQLESGQSRPSVGTLYSIVTELGVSLDQVIRGEHYAPDGNGASAADSGPAARSPVAHPGERPAIDLDSGVRWEELTADQEGIDFLHVTYEVGGASTSDESSIRHAGREYGYVMTGTSPVLNSRCGIVESNAIESPDWSSNSWNPIRIPSVPVMT